MKTFLAVGIAAVLCSIGAFAQERPDSAKTPRSHEEIFEEMLRGRTGTIKAAPPSRPIPEGSLSYPNVNISKHIDPQNEPSVRISHKNPNRMVAAWRDFRTGVDPAVRRVGYSFSNDGGSTWSVPQLLPLLGDSSYTRHTDPSVAVDTAGNFYIATLALDDSNYSRKFLVFKSNPLLDVFDEAFPAPAGPPQFGYDKEYIECDLSPGSPYVNNLYMVWSGANFSRSTDAGATWSDEVMVSDQGGFAPDLCVTRDGVIGVSYVVAINQDAVTFDRSTNGGETWGQDVVVDSMILSNTCDVYLTAGLTSIATDLSDGPFGGNIYLAWSSANLGDYDIFVNVSSDSGATWSPRHRVNDDLVGNGKEQIWPWIAVDDSGIVSIVYYDNRNSPDCEITDTYLARSSDGGMTFTNTLLSTAQSPKNMPNGAVRFGDYIGLDSWGGHTVPVWTDERAGGFNMEIYTAVIGSHFSGLQYRVRPGWNMFSIPLELGNDTAGAVFPEISGTSYAWDAGYVPRSTFSPGAGYWVKFPDEGVINVIGDSVFIDTVAVVEGWNLIGGPVNPSPIASILSDPPGISTSAFYDFNRGPGYYQSYAASDTLFPGFAYWVKAAQAGMLIIGGGSKSLPRAGTINVRPSAEMPPAYRR